MATESVHLSIWIDRSAAEVYDFAVQPENLPTWAAGLGGNIERVGTQWMADSPMGRVVVAFVPRNEFGVLDHDVTLPSGVHVRNPVRVMEVEGGSEVVFTVRHQAEQTDDEFAADQKAVSADLATLKELLEAG